MKKALFSALVTAQLMTQLYAGGDIIPFEVTEPKVIEHREHEESKYYIIIKGLMILGETVNHESMVLNGDKNYGFGLDIGYRIGNGFALEYDFSFATNTVTETGEHGVEKAIAIYSTSSLDLVYIYELTHRFGLLAKLGYEYEVERIPDFGIYSADDHGFIFGTGLEVAINEDYKVLVEYEHSTIKGPRGGSLFAGVMFNF